jgi:hypothetical protein
MGFDAGVLSERSCMEATYADLLWVGELGEFSMHHASLGVPVAYVAISSILLGCLAQSFGTQREESSWELES